MNIAAFQGCGAEAHTSGVKNTAKNESVDIEDKFRKYIEEQCPTKNDVINVLMQFVSRAKMQEILEFNQYLYEATPTETTPTENGQCKNFPKEIIKYYGK